MKDHGIKTYYWACRRDELPITKNAELGQGEMIPIDQEMVWKTLVIKNKGKK